MNMIKAIILMLTLLFVSSSFADNGFKLDGEHNKSMLTQQPSLDDLKIQLKKVKNPLEAFYIQTNIVRMYQSMPINEKFLNDEKLLAEQLIKKAASYPKNWNYGNAIHQGNLLLGRLQLAQGNIAKAKKYLALAGRTPGSPQLDSFGPNMTLAQELLAKNQKEAVLNYIDACGKFWNSPLSKESSAKWKQAIAHGENPNFGASLKY